MFFLLPVWRIVIQRFEELNIECGLSVVLYNPFHFAFVHSDFNFLLSLTFVGGSGLDFAGVLESV
jgi:hypothetical protein